MWTLTNKKKINNSLYSCSYHYHYLIHGSDLKLSQSLNQKLKSLTKESLKELPLLHQIFSDIEHPAHQRRWHRVLSSWPSGTPVWLPARSHPHTEKEQWLSQQLNSKWNGTCVLCNFFFCPFAQTQFQIRSV